MACASRSGIGVTSIDAKSSDAQGSLFLLTRPFAERKATIFRGAKMVGWRSLLIMAASLTLASRASAGDANRCGPFWGSWPATWRVCPPLCGCPDDYDCKRAPCVCVPNKCCQPDDYCRKPMPCVPVVRCGLPDDYCRKPMPCRLCPVATPDYKCGPPPCKLTP